MYVCVYVCMCVSVCSRWVQSKSTVFFHFDFFLFLEFTKFGFVWYTSLRLLKGLAFSGYPPKY